MSNYAELMAQAQALMTQAEQARKEELASVIADIKSKMKQFGITVAGLGATAAGPSKNRVYLSPQPQPSTVSPMASCGLVALAVNPSGCVPSWLLASSIDEFLI